MALGLYEVIQFEGKSDVVVWKHPVEDFNTRSVLHVHESQVAFIYSDGDFQGPIPPGKHNLYNDNVPVFKGITAFLGNGKSPNHEEVYFVNMAHQVSGMWAVPGITFRMTAGEYANMPVTIGISGGISFSISDPETIMRKLVLGNGKEILYQEDLIEVLNPLYTPLLKENFNDVIKANNIDIFEIDSKMSTISTSLKDCINDFFDEYGVKIERFTLSGITKNEDYERMKKQIQDKAYTITDANTNQTIEAINANTDRIKTVTSADATATANNLLGIKEIDKMATDILKTSAGNPSSGGLSPFAMEVGTMPTAFAMGETMSNVAQNLLSQTSFAGNAVGGQDPLAMQQPQDLSFETPIGNGSGKKSVQERVAELEQLKPLLTEEQYKGKLSEILNDI